MSCATAIPNILCLYMPSKQLGVSIFDLKIHNHNPNTDLFFLHNWVTKSRNQQIRKIVIQNVAPRFFPYLLCTTNHLIIRMYNSFFMGKKQLLECIIVNYDTKILMPILEFFILEKKKESKLGGLKELGSKLDG